MFEKSSTLKRFSGPRKKVIGVHLGYVPQLDAEPERERSGVKLAVVLAVAVHLGFFLIHFPSLRGAEIEEPPAKQAYVVKQIRFSPPQPQPQKLVPKRQKKTKKIPIPDPTPNDPEPIVDLLELPEIEVEELGEAVFGIPDGPPGPVIAGLGPDGPWRPGGDVTPPEKIFYPSPTYTEEGRQNRVQGVVILEAIVDAMGNVASVKVLKGLPMGLSDSAVETAREWRFKPATRFGEPVAVLLNLTIRFSLQ